MSPKERNSHSFVRDSKNKKIYLFGGANNDGPLNDLYEFDEETFSWTYISTTGICPPVLEMHTGHLWYDKGRAKLLIFGG